LVDALVYLSQDLRNFFRDLTTGLTKLNFVDNFFGFEFSGTIAAGTEKAIINQMGAGHIPTDFLITSISGQPTIVKGDTAWTSNTVYLKNTATNTTATLTVFFYR